MQTVWNQTLNSYFLMILQHCKKKKNILLIGLTSFNAKVEVPNDINKSSLFIPINNLKSQEFIDQIQIWTEMELNAKVIIFNFTRNNHFFTRVTIGN